jgi:hypothetical protein
LKFYYKYIGEKPLSPFVWLYVSFLLYLGIIKKCKNMKKVNEFKKFLDENVDEIKDLLVDVFECDEDDVNEVVSFEDDEFGGFIGCDEKGEGVVFGCNLYEYEVDDEDVSVGMEVIEGKEVYFVCYDF